MTQYYPPSLMERWHDHDSRGSRRIKGMFKLKNKLRQIYEIKGINRMETYTKGIVSKLAIWKWDKWDK